jgi:hypothetical protein
MIPPSRRQRFHTRITALALVLAHKAVIPTAAKLYENEIRGGSPKE